MNDALNDLINKALKDGYIYKEELQKYYHNNNTEYEKIIKKLNEEDIDVITQEDGVESIPENIEEVDEDLEKLPRPVDSLTAYINDIKGFPLLTAEEELALADEIKAGREALEILEKDENLSLEEKERYQDIVDRAEASKEYFINCNLRLVVWWSSKYRNKGLPQDDLIQEGNMGLMNIQYLLC